MRLMWLWVLLYALGIGLILFIIGLFTALCCGEVETPSGIVITQNGTAYDIWLIAAMVAFIAPVCGFLVFIPGTILLLIRRKFSAGRVVSLIGIGLYHLAALGVVLAGAMQSAMSVGSPWDIVIAIAIYILVMAVIVALPAFFIIRKFRRLQEAETIET